MIFYLPILCRLGLLGLALLSAGYSHGTEQTEEANFFRRHCAELARAAEKTGSIAVAGNDGWFFLTSELRHIGAGKFWGKEASSVSKASKAEAADPLPAILDFNEQLKKIGVKLIIVPVPPKSVIYPEMLAGFTNAQTHPPLSPGRSASAKPGRGPLPGGDHNILSSNLLSSPPVEGWLKAGVGSGSTASNMRNTDRLDTFHQEFYALLRTNGVAVLDLTDLFLQKKNGPQGPLYCRQDSHWSGSGCVLAAQQIATEALPLIGGNGKERKNFQSVWLTNEISGDLWQALNDKNVFKEKLRIRKIVKSGSGEPISPDSNSKIILLGDSHNLIFHAGDDMLSQGAGLPDQLAFEFSCAVDLIAVRGSGATPARINLLRRAQQNKDYWKNKKCVIWCFSAREFTESDGWRKVPIK